MYKDIRQLRIEDFVFPYGNLDPENDWVKLAALVPWDTAEERYAAQFVNNGAPVPGGIGVAAHPAAAEMQRRMAGEAHRRESVSAILHRDEGVRSVPLWRVHASGVPEAVP